MAFIGNLLFMLARFPVKLRMTNFSHFAEALLYTKLIWDKYKLTYLVISLAKIADVSFV